ncbi:MAG: hypothetical protein QW346_02025 [Candidatus Micrarchaeaceae archaeon]
MHNKYLTVLLYALLILLSLLFVAYFIVLNNDAFILYSFVLFVLLGIALSIARKWQSHSVALSIVLIAASSAAYTGIASNLALYAVASIAILSAIIALRLFRSYLVYIFWAFVLPLAFGAMKMSSTLLINVAIIGYYLLISSVLAIFINLASEDSKLHLGIMLANAFKRHDAAISYAAIILAIVLLAVPIWPQKPALILGTLTYAALNASSLAPGLYTVNVNGSSYLGIASQNMGNLRLFADGQGLHAYIGKNATSSSIFPLIFSLNKSASDIQLYFIPNATFNSAPNATFGSTLSLLNDSAFSALYRNATRLSTGFGPLQNVVNGFVNVTKTYNVSAYKNYSSNSTLNVAPYYALDSVCGAGPNATVEFSVASNRSISLFMLGSLSNYSSAVATDSIGLVLSYGHFLRSFKEHSYYSVLNATSAGLNTTLNGCSYYVVASQVYAVVRVHDYQRYVLHYSATKTVQVPAIFASGGRVQRSGFLPGSLYYIASLYANETA